MWYEILPSMALVWAFVAVPTFAAPVFNYAFTGKFSQRRWENSHQDFHLYLRDQRITGSEYKPRGLEGVPAE